MTQIASPTRTYDDFTGSRLDPARWFHLEYPPGPDGTSWRCEEPNARTDVGDGTLDISIERFERAHDQVQIMDNPKHLLLSTESFPVPADGSVTISLEIAATSINATPRDYRDGFASFNVLDMASGWVFDLCATSDQVIAIHERLPLPGVDRTFTHVIEAPLAGLEIAPGLSHAYEVTLDAGRRVAEWRVDGRLMFDVADAEIPGQVSVGLGFITLHPIADGRSRSLRGQGISASFGPIQVRTSS
ncbi:MAG: hypothetical protein EKK42_18890 [Pseudonocardiaceae bacterium]|nr:MAG: hypothetical protein EKK42_18890 [Pseudonocardiaceae bacterium]